MSFSDSPGVSWSLAVVGGGIVGLSMAWRLAQLGWRVTVFDQAKAGGEASWAGAGMLSPGGEVEGDSELARIAIESRNLYPGFVRELEIASGVPIDYQDCGAIELAFSDDEVAALEGKAAVQAQLGIVSKPVSALHVRTFWPRIATEGLAAARFYPGDGIVNPREVVQALLTACRALGLVIVEDTPVKAIRIADNTATVSASTGSQSFAAIAIAAGAWSSSIQVSGVPALPASEPVKGHLIGYAQPLQTCNTIIRRGHTYLLQRANGLLIAGASVEHCGFDRSVNAAVAASLAAEAGFLLPHLTETTPTEVWTGFRPGGDLCLGTWHSDRLYLAYGHYRNGILLAPYTADRIASVVTASLGKPTPAPAAPPQSDPERASGA